MWRGETDGRCNKIWLYMNGDIKQESTMKGEGTKRTRVMGDRVRDGYLATMSMYKTGG